MAKDKKDLFVDPSRISVIIPYSDLEKLVEMVPKLEQMEAENKRMRDQYDAIYSMFSEALQVVREIREYVKDT